MSRRRKGQESGFALLFVMAAAAIIGIMLYLEMPRIAFEAQRTKEGDLIMRGEQYKRAIQLFVRRFNRYPAAIGDLENTNNMRFLRKRYKDPMTGKDDWRLIHNTGGFFTDSLTMKPPGPKGTTDAAQLGSADTGDGSQAGPQRWQLRRGGETPPPDAVPGEPDAQTDTEAADEQQQAAAPEVPVVGPGLNSQPTLNTGDTGVPGAAQLGAPQPGQPGYAPGGVPQPGQPGYQLSGPPGFQPGVPPQPGQRPYRPGTPVYGSQPLYPPVPLPGMPNSGNTGASNPALSTIDNQLSGGSSLSGATGGSFGMTSAGAGIGGVASKSKVAGIRVYKDHTKYNEWEFLYDPRQDILGMGGMQPNTGTPFTGGAPGAPLATPTGTQTPSPGPNTPNRPNL
jgi:type II secretory pathway pseudopilin PulG